MRLRKGVAARVRFNVDGLIPAAAQDIASGQVLMPAWMDGEVLVHTLTSGRTTYWSRSRQIYWIKGETSGNHQRVIPIHPDCDGDIVLLRVKQTGTVRHTDNLTCLLIELTGSDVGC